MKRIAAYLTPLWLATAAWAAGHDIAVPSGQAIAFHEMIRDRPGGDLTVRFRFIAPDIANDAAPDYEVVERDMAHLCQKFVLPQLAEADEVPGQIVISLADQITEFGQPAPQATQFFEAYSIAEGQCIWEPF